MKQGRAHHSKGGRHVEPKSKEVDPEFVAQLGAHRGAHVMDKGDIPFKTVQMYKDGGMAPPICKTVVHSRGSQGRR